MPETFKQTQVFRFDQMAVQVKDKVDPAEADVDRYVGLEHIDPESLKIRRWGETSDVESSKIIFKSGDIIFGKRRAYQRKLAVADFDGICSAHAMVLRPKTDVVLEEFLPFFMQSDIFMDRAVKISVGGLSPTINWGDLAKEEFALPPLGEQRRIAEALSAAETARVAHSELISAADVAATAVIERILVGRENEIPPELCGKVDLGTWTTQTVGELCTLGSGHGFKQGDWSEEGMPIIRIQNVRGSKDFNYFNGDPEPAWIVEPGELLFAWAGVPGVSFGPGIWDGPRAVLNQHIYRITPNPGISRDWLFEAILYLTPRIERRAHGFKSSLLHIRKREFTSREILVPPPDQQEVVAECIRGLREKQALMAQRLSMTEALRTSLLTTAIGGQT